MVRSYDLPPVFVKMWNEFALDKAIDALDLATLKGFANVTPTTDDDEFLKDLEAFTTSTAEPKELHKELCAFSRRAADAGLEVEDVAVVFAQKPQERTVTLGGTGDFCKGEIVARGKTDAFFYRADTSYKIEGDVGYLYSIWKGKDNASLGKHGIHADVSYAPWKNRSVAFALESQIDFLFNGLVIAAGAGGGLHLGYEDKFEVYIKGLGNYHTMMKEKERGWEDGWSVDGYAGAKLSIFYAEAGFTFAGSEFRPEAGFSAGLRFTFGSAATGGSRMADAQ